MKLQTVVVGLMSGTSVDGVDVALCRFEEDVSLPGDAHHADAPLIELDVLAYSEQPFSPELRAQVFASFGDMLLPAALCELNFALGEAFADAATHALAQAGYAIAEVDVIASHGQTIYHQVAAGHRLSTLQMGEAAVIAERTGVSVAYDFRTADMAAGGQGAPLVPYFDALFLGHGDKTRVLLNIGGIGNITVLPVGGGPPLAFDTGPGNMIIDYAAHYFSDGAHQFDQNGHMAAQGRVDAGWLAELLQHPYLDLKPPKSTGREVFGDAFARAAIERAAELGLNAEDTIATLTAFTARSIATALRRFVAVPIDEVIVSGGGAYNPVLMGMLDEWLSGMAVVTHDSYGVRAQAKEAVAFALLGYELLRNRPANIGTGALRPAVLGKLAPGLNYAKLLQKYAPYMRPFHPEDKATWQTLPRLHSRPTSKPTTPLA